MFDKVGVLPPMRQAQRVIKLRQEYDKLEKVGCKNELSFKHAIASIQAMTNFLKDKTTKSNFFTPFRFSAVEATQARQEKLALPNKKTKLSKKLSRKKSTGKSLSGKRGTKSFAKSSHKRTNVNCTTCRDFFDEFPSVYEGHMSGSPLCPNRGFYLAELKGKTADEKKKTKKKRKAELLQVSD